MIAQNPIRVGVFVAHVGFIAHYVRIFTKILRCTRNRCLVELSIIYAVVLLGNFRHKRKCLNDVIDAIIANVIA